VPEQRVPGRMPKAARRRGMRSLRTAIAQSMIPKSVQRFSEKIMLKQKARAG
jgi:hypothetical protein